MIVPDLSDTGFRPVGGRSFATEEGAAAMVVYRGTAGYIISFYVRSRGPRRHLLPRGKRADGGLLAQYGSGKATTTPWSARSIAPARKSPPMHCSH